MSLSNRIYHDHAIRDDSDSDATSSCSSSSSTLTTDTTDREETSPLLSNNFKSVHPYTNNKTHHHHRSNKADNFYNSIDGSTSSSSSSHSVRQELKWLTTHSLPIIGTYLLQNSFQLASIFTLGHLGSMELGASALASMFVNVSAWSVAYGTTTALDTLCSQCWTASKDKTIIGVYLQRAYLVLSLLFIPIAFIWWSATPIMLKFNQDPDLAELAGLFLRYLLPGAPAYIAFEATKRYLQAQGIMQASTYCMLITAPVNFILNYSFVYPCQLGFIGAPLATSLSYWIMFGLLLLYTKYVAGYEGWGGWSRQCLKDWWPFVKLASSGIVIICAEWSAFEIASLAASYLGTIDLAAQSILITISSATYTVPLGISVAATNRVGNVLGSGDSIKARRATRSALLFAVAFGCLNSTFVLLFRTQLGKLFSSDQEVIDRVALVLPLFAVFQIADGLASVGGGVIRGMGRQSVAAWINLIAYYLVALPIGFLLTFHVGWNLLGLWTGLSIALFLVATGELWYLSRVNWVGETERAQRHYALSSKRPDQSHFLHHESHEEGRRKRRHTSLDYQSIVVDL
ncbi:mate-domain-containing protein [Mycotypha africana]|uniref:mate-domain-containing protein n=1 Tax=Mycotypha africana TaxID=64632 RepID=UPI00230096D9|nr:mate-domain-containing protein [Mycotypha africana]KAI8975040.1 mate-domain-containing protein [Mycotypha africana]